MRFLLFLSLCLMGCLSFCQVVANAQESATLSESAKTEAEWLAQRAVLYKEFVDKSYKVVGRADQGSETNAFLVKLSSELEKLVGPPASPPLPPAYGADKLRITAFLTLMKCRILKLRSKTGGAGQTDPVEIRQELAHKALEKIKDGLPLAERASKPNDPDTTPEQKKWLLEENVIGYLQILKAHAYAVLVDAGAEPQTNRANALAAWKEAEKAYEGNPPLPADELEAILKPTPTPPTAPDKPGEMTPVAWVGLAMLLLGLLLPYFVKPATAEGAWALRAFVALGAACLATVITGMLQVKVSDWIVAGGAFAVVIVIYMRNPPVLPIRQDVPADALPKKVDTLNPNPSNGSTSSKSDIQTLQPVSKP